MVTVGQVARPHGLRGQVVVNPESDFVESRFCAGSVLHAWHGDHIATLTVRAVRWLRTRPILAFEEADSIDEIAWLAGQEVRVPESALAVLPEGRFYRHDLVGCRVETSGGRTIGRVSDVQGSGDGSCLVVEGERGREVLIPLAAGICLEIDPPGRRIVIEPLEGLLELNEPRSRV